MSDLGEIMSRGDNTVKCEEVFICQCFTPME